MREETDEYAHTLYYQDSNFQIVDRVTELANRKNVTPAQIAFLWLLHQEGVTDPIIGASKLEHLNDAICVRSA